MEMAPAERFVLHNSSQQSSSSFTRRASAQVPPAKRDRVADIDESTDSNDGLSPPRKRRKHETREKPLWSKNDQAILETTFAEELALWKLCDRLLDDVTPVQLLQHLRVEQTGATGKDILWPRTLCTELKTIICCPALQNRGLLCFAIQKAMHCRSKRLQAPDVSLLLSGRNERVIDLLQAQFPNLSDSDRETLEGLLNTSLGRDRPAHTGFLKHIRRAERSLSTSRGRYAVDYDTPGIIARDIKAVSAAWDNYATSDEHQRELKTIQEYSAIKCKKRKSMGTARVLELKKLAIIEQRMEAKFRDEEGDRDFNVEVAESMHSEEEDSQRKHNSSTMNNRDETSDVELGSAWNRDFQEDDENEDMQTKEEEQDVNADLRREIYPFGKENRYPRTSVILSDSDEELLPLSKKTKVTFTQDRHAPSRTHQPVRPLPQSKQPSTHRQLQEPYKRQESTTTSKANKVSQISSSPDTSSRYSFAPSPQRGLSHIEKSRPQASRASTSQNPQETTRYNNGTQAHLPNSSTPQNEADFFSSTQAPQWNHSTRNAEHRLHVTRQPLHESAPIESTNGLATKQPSSSSLKQEQGSRTPISLSASATAAGFPRRFPSLADLIAERLEKARAT